MITMMIIVDNRVLAEMEGWEGIGQEELAALRHQVSKQIIHQNYTKSFSSSYNSNANNNKNCQPFSTDDE